MKSLFYSLFAVACALPLIASAKPLQHTHSHHVSNVGSNKLALGDSLAVGFGGASHATVSAKVGASSCAIASMVPHKHFDVVLISAGTNDPPGPCVHHVRELVNEYVTPRRVIWLLPVIHSARATVLAEAVRWHDGYVSYVPSQEAWPHPSAYYRLF